MAWSDRIGKLLKPFATGSAGAAATPARDVETIFEQVAIEAPGEVVAESLAAAFRSNQTPAFGDLLKTLFARSNPEQKAGLLNQFLLHANPEVIRKILAGSGLEGIVGTAGAKISADQAQKLSSDTVRELATQAEKADPSIIDPISKLYAQHPGLVKALGGAVLSIALSKIAERQQKAA
jgi:hypothetical protein